MKKTLWLTLILVLVCIFAFSACDSGDTPPTNTGNDQQTTDNNNQDTDSVENNSSENNSNENDSANIPIECQHAFGSWSTVKQATCKEEGKIVRTCNKCSETEETTVSKTDVHAEVIDAAVAATCTADGKTEGKHCSVCDKIIVAQATVDKLGHVEVIDAAVAATCTTDGKAEGKHCSRCNATLVAQTTIGKLGHVEVIDAAVAATCTTDGKTEGKHCSRCNAIFVRQNTISKKEHSYTSRITAPTCTTQGFTEYHCVCGQQYTDDYVSVLDHSFFEYTSDKNATCFEDGTKSAVCEYGCGHIDTIEDIGSKLTNSLYFTLDSSQEYYIVSNVGTCMEENLTIPSTHFGLPVKIIATRAFAECDFLKSVTIPNSITVLEEECFIDCTNLEKVVFEKDSQLKTIGENAFVRNVRLSELLIPQSVITIKRNPFGYCVSLKLYCESSNKRTGWGEQWNSGLKSYFDVQDYGIDENGYKWIKKSDNTITITDYLGTNTNVIIPTTINGNIVTCIDDAFDDNDTIETVIIPLGVKTIGHTTFYHCDKLKSVSIPNSVESIGNGAFYGCHRLETIFIPNSVITIYGNAFYLCNRVIIYCEVESKPSGWDAYWNNWGCTVVWGHTL